MRESPVFHDAVLTESAGDSLADRGLIAIELPVGEIVGRYVVVARLGAGGMGVVYAAYDPQLDRKVALKLLRTPSSAGTPAAVRLLREAQALAKLAHPNVVAIYDVGVHGDGVWIAMEFLEGRTLSQWLREQSRGWRDVLAVMLQVGRGLAAAHTVGLVHRDLKPDNIMVCGDGRVRVMDFGLARATDSEEAPSPAAPVVDGSALRSDVTRAGAFVGTPGYMSTEQWNGVAVDARSDQFSYCVTLFEALYGQRAFAGETLAELAVHVAAGNVRVPPRGTKVPGHISRAVLRGLASEREQRWPSMAELLAALQRDPGRRRKRALKFAVVAVVALGAWGWHELGQRRRLAACDEDASRIDGIWNDSARSDVRAAIVASGIADGEDMWMRLQPWVDRHADAWRTTARDVCLQAELATVSASERERASECLSERLDELEVLIGVLAGADRHVADDAIQQTAGLPAAGSCADARALAQRVAMPDDIDRRERVKQVRREMARARITARSDRADEVRQTIADLEREAEAIGHPPIIAEMHWIAALLLSRIGDWEEATAAGERAFLLATEIGADEIAVRSGTALVTSEGGRLQRFEAGLRWGRLTEAVLTRTGEGHDLLAADLWTSIGVLESKRGEAEPALELLERALALRERVLGAEHPDVAATLGHIADALTPSDPRRALEIYARILVAYERMFGADHPSVASTLNNMARAHALLGETTEALRVFERALAVGERAFAPGHPYLASTVHNVGAMHVSLGHNRQALEWLERGLALRRAALGEDHPDIAMSLHAIGSVWQELGDRERARDYLERALDAYTRTRGSDDPAMAGTLNALGQMDREEGRFEAALAHHRRALAIQEAGLGRDHPDVAYSLFDIGYTSLIRDDYADALPLLERAVAIWEAALGPEAPLLAHPLTAIGRALMGLDRPSEAVPPLERALALRERGGATPTELAETQFMLARALYDAPADRPRARELAHAAVTNWERGEGEGDRHRKSAEEAAAIRRWLQRHP